MALVIPKTRLSDFMGSELIITDPIVAPFSIDGVEVAKVYTYPAQGEFALPVEVAVLNKQFVDFTTAVGPQGTTTSEMIMEKLGTQGFSQAAADTIAADFAKAFRNYEVIPESVEIIIAVLPVASINDLMPPPTPVDEAAAGDVIEGEVVG